MGFFSVCYAFITKYILRWAKESPIQKMTVSKSIVINIGIVLQ